MKLVFKKGEDHQISVFREINGSQEEFSYVEMIKELIDSKELEEPDISEGFSDAEISSIKSMVNFINKEISETDESDDTDSS